MNEKARSRAVSVLVNPINISVIAKTQYLFKFVLFKKKYFKQQKN
jgi:hypothetical protein